MLALSPFVKRLILMKTPPSVRLIALRRRMERTLFEDTLAFGRASLILSALTLVFSSFTAARRSTRFMTLDMAGCLIALPLAFFLPEPRMHPQRRVEG